MKTFVSTDWLYKNHGKKNLIIFDCSWHIPNTYRNPLNEFKKRHIKNSQFFDIDKISNQKTKLPHMVPAAGLFQNTMRFFGVNNNSTIVVYDTLGIFSSARVWWLFKYFGYEKIFVMNGGLRKWLNENKPVTKKTIKPNKGNFKVKVIQSLKTNYKMILKNLNNKKLIILDARNKNRFKGMTSEPRPNLRSGHIPKSKNLFWGHLITINGTIKSKKSLKEILKKYKLNNKKNIVTSCGSGVTACILSLALLHNNDLYSKVYDGSWSEWGSKKELPIER